MNQCARILRHLWDFGSITSAEAMEQYGIARLASRINDLRKDGVLIKTEFVRGKNRYDEPTRYAKYSLEGRK